MWREDDFEDKGKRVKVGVNDRPTELADDSDLNSEGKAERSDEEPRSRGAVRSTAFQAEVCSTMKTRYKLPPKGRTTNFSHENVQVFHFPCD
jgi:hypothetical protein